MGVWADLPAELAIKVLQALDPALAAKPVDFWLVRNRVAPELLSCTYVSRQFRAIIEPLLYRDICLPAQWNGKNGDDEFRNLRQFTRAVTLRPELSRNVRKLIIPSMDGDMNHDIDATIAKSNIVVGDGEVSKWLSQMGEAASHDLKHILDSLPQYGLSNGVVVYGGANGILLALLHLLPTLRSLEIEARSEVEYIARSCFGVFHGGVPAGLKSIFELTVCYEDTENGFHSGAIIPFLALPSLNSVTFGAYGAEEDEEDGLPLQIGVDISASMAQPLSDSITGSALITKKSTGFALPTQSSPVANLSFLGSVVACNIINKILSVPSRLEKFEYELGGATVGYEPFRPAQFLPGLLIQASFLRELAIDTEMMDEMEDDEPFIGSLSGLLALEKLRIPARLLLSTIINEEDGGVAHNPMDDILPPNLILLELNIHDLPLRSFLASTGLPQSIRFTRHQIPSLVSFNLQGTEPSDQERLKEMVHQLSALRPPMNGVL